jgi:hypothetical protein
MPVSCCPFHHEGQRLALPHVLLRALWQNKAAANGKDSREAYSSALIRWWSIRVTLKNRDPQQGGEGDLRRCTSSVTLCIYTHLSHHFVDIVPGALHKVHLVVSTCASARFRATRLESALHGSPSQVGAHSCSREAPTQRQSTLFRATVFQSKGP